MGQIRTLFHTAIGDVDTTQKETLGALRVEDGAWYKYVKILNDTATVAGVAGDPVAFTITVGGVTYDGVGNHVCVIDLSDAATQPIGAGFLTGTVTGTVDVAYYTWIQIRGQVTVPTAVTTGVVGSGCMMATSASDKTLLVATGVIAPIAILTTATAANNKVLANCPF